MTSDGLTSGTGRAYRRPPALCYPGLAPGVKPPIMAEGCKLAGDSPAGPRTRDECSARAPETDAAWPPTALGAKQGVR
jgi:hypothetical protein